MATHKYCDGIRRRDFLQAGVLSGLGLSLSDYLRLAEASETRSTKAKSAIFINLGGGPSHIDSFDMKPDSPAEYRGEFNPIGTNVPGIQICEHLPKLARCTDKFAILRGVSHSLAAHQLGTIYMNTGNRPTPALEYPGYGAVVSKELAGDRVLPPFIAIPTTRQTAGYLGVRYSPLQTKATPTPGRPFSVRGISLAGEITVADVERRGRLLRDVNRGFSAVESKSDLLQGLDKFRRQAYQMVSSPQAREAFDVSREPADVAERFGSHGFGQSCLLACRLIEAGVRFVTVSLGGWDTHQQNFARLSGRGAPAKGKYAGGLLPQLDDGLSALLALLQARDRLGSTAVFVTGEFGRTPKINARGGRDHWARAMFVLLAGGGIKGGQALGASDDKAMGPAGDGFSPDDVAASFFHCLGIDHTKEFHTSTGRPVMIVRNGKIIEGLLG